MMSENEQDENGKSCEIKFNAAENGIIAGKLAPIPVRSPFHVECVRRELGTQL